jgi:hypothetical protein
MKKLTYKLLVPLLLAGLSSCEKDNFQLDGRLEDQQLVAPLMFEAFVEEADTSYNIGLNLVEEQLVVQQIAAVGTISQDETESILYLGIGKVPDNPTSPERFPFSIKFRTDGLDPSIAPDKETLRDFFSIGRTFPFGEENGEAQVGILLPTSEMFDERSRSEFLASPVGVVEVVRIDTFLAPFTGIEEVEREYLMITFDYSGVIGIHNRREESAAERNGEVYVASQTAQVSGTATLVLAATPG